ncbi:Protein of unknown function [Cotesia congregata]|uniref:Uncharacterized protein n=1 Tax=Cotesia congregata TaxID=51543 RepID=A0A8J2MDW4_COTCN|nr:Protein of unknown function [Cotesia congregata]
MIILIGIYVLLREIFDFILAKKVTKEQILGFESVIRRHHLLYIELTGGPISHVSSIHSKSKHTHLTRSASFMDRIIYIIKRFIFNRTRHVYSPECITHN